MDNHRLIEDLLHHYADLVDAGDFAGIGQLFARGQVMVPALPQPVHGVAEIQRMYETSTRRYPCGTPRTQHVVSNIRITIDTDGCGASSLSRFTVFQALEDFPLQAIITGRYEDRFLRDNEGWYFSQRRVLPELIGDLSRHLLIEMPRPEASKPG
jgi:3-phenylpropionate/cinnamic acid dioxygenase small subunit